MSINIYTDLKPLRIIGNWDQGYALDVHTVSCIPIGMNEFGHMQYDTVRTELGEMVYQFKYQENYNKLFEIIELIKPFLLNWNEMSTVNVVIPVPSSNKIRRYQPVHEIACQVAAILGVNCLDDMLEKKSVTQSKGMSIEDKKQIIGTIIKLREFETSKNVLVVDDLFDTGTTLNECVRILRQDENVSNVYTLTMTRTKG